MSMTRERNVVILWGLAAVVAAIIGVASALTANGQWYSIVTAVILLMAGGVFGSRAVLALRGTEGPRSRN